MIKFRLNKPRPKGWGKPKNLCNAHAVKRRTGKARTTNLEREVMREVMPPPIRKGKRDYLYANCVVLAAAIFGSSSQAWAEAMLPAARQLDARGAR